MRPLRQKLTPFSTIFAFLFFIEAVSTSASAQRLFSISEPRFASYVSARPSFALSNELEGKISRSSLRRREIWLLVTIIGDAGTYRYLKENGSLWLEADIWGDGRKWDVVEIGLGSDDWEGNAESFASELQEKGVFTWRTRMMTTKVDVSRLEIKFFDKNGNVISPINYAGSYAAVISFK